MVMPGTHDEVIGQMNVHFVSHAGLYIKNEEVTKSPKILIRQNRKSEVMLCIVNSDENYPDSMKIT